MEKNPEDSLENLTLGPPSICAAPSMLPQDRNAQLGETEGTTVLSIHIAKKGDASSYFMDEACSPQFGFSSQTLGR